MDTDFQAQEAYSQKIEDDCAAFQKDVEDGFVDKDGMPLKCKECSHTSFGYRNVDRMDNTLMSYDEHCGLCGAFANHWDTGHYQVPTP